MTGFDEVTKDLLYRASYIIELNGLSKGFLRHPHGLGFCANGAIGKARSECINSERDMEFDWAWNEAIQVLREFIPSEFNRVLTWNDDESTTAEDVVNTMRRAADSL